MTPVVIRSYPAGPRVWICGQRLHHGATGAALVAGGLRRNRPAVCIAGLALMLHDRADWRRWFAREGLETAGLCVTKSHLTSGAIRP